MPSVAIIGTRGYPSYYGGFETAVRRIAPYLVDAGWSVTAYGRKGAVAESDPDRDRRVISRYTRGVNSKSLSTLSFGATASAATMLKKPDVALVMNVANGYFLPALKARGIPTLLNVDGIEWDRAKWNRAAKGVFRGGARMSARWADNLVFDAQEIARRWEADFGVSGTFIPYGGDPHEELPLQPGLRHREYVLYVARFVPENSVNEFFAAARTIAERWPVVIVGSDGFNGSLDQAASELASSSPNIHWLGHVSSDDRLKSLWQHSGVYFHGHSVGGTNPALVQAMASGAPVVARNTVYNREVLGDAGQFTELDPRRMAEAISNLMASEDKDQLGLKAVARARAAYSWESVCAGYEAALTALLRK